MAIRLHCPSLHPRWLQVWRRFEACLLAALLLLVLMVLMLWQMPQARAQTQAQTQAQTPPNATVLQAQAAPTEPVQPTLRATLDLGEEALRVQSEALLTTLPDAVQETLRKGVAIYFTTEAKLYQWQWWYFDKQLARATRTVKLSYQPLLNNYQVTFGGFTQQFATLKEALGVAGNASLGLAHRSTLEDGERYYVTVSFSLDLSQLSRAQQIGLESDPQWQLHQRAELSFRTGAYRAKP